jgi:5-deoxy-glucuronate isomerase
MLEKGLEMDHLIRPDHSSEILINITPTSAGWKYLSFSVVSMSAGDTRTVVTVGNEMAFVPLEGQGVFSVNGQQHQISRKSVFDEPPHILYVPPDQKVTIKASADFEFAYGGAPAEGKYPMRLFEPSEMKQEVRGGGVATRQVNHVLSYPLPAERLILFEVYVPGGMYSGWPPHCHDRYAGSPYLEEVYYYRVNPQEGYAIHRNYRLDNDFDEVFTVRNGDLVLVTQGFHPVAVPPGSNVYFLNYLAGDLLSEDRGTPPYDDPNWAWMKEDYEGNKMKLPVFEGG